MRDRALRWGRTLLASLICLAVVAGLGFIAYRPAVVLGVDENALAHSVLNEAGGNSREGTCVTSDEGWLCTIKAEGDYIVEVGDNGCWKAKRTAAEVKPKRKSDPPAEKKKPGKGAEAGAEDAAEGGSEPAEEASGCIGVFDYIRIV